MAKLLGGSRPHPGGGYRAAIFDGQRVVALGLKLYYTRNSAAVAALPLLAQVRSERPMAGAILEVGPL